MYPQYAPQQQAPPPQQQQHRAPQHYAAPPGGFRQAPPQQRYPQQQQQQQPAMRSRRSAESDFFRGQYDSELRSLGAHPDKELISSLTQHAQEHLGSPPDRVRAHDVVDVIQRRIGGVRYDEYIYPTPFLTQRCAPCSRVASAHALLSPPTPQAPPEMMLPLLYVLDSIVFNDATRTYETVFGANILATFQLAFSSVPLTLVTSDRRNVRERMARLCTAWQGRPQFSPQAVGAMLAFVASGGGGAQHPPQQRGWAPPPPQQQQWQQPQPQQQPRGQPQSRPQFAPQPRTQQPYQQPQRGAGWGGAARPPPQQGGGWSQQQQQPPPQPHQPQQPHPSHAQPRYAPRPAHSHAGGGAPLGRGGSAGSTGSAAAASSSEGGDGSGTGWGEARDLIDAMYAGLPHQCTLDGARFSTAQACAAHHGFLEREGEQQRQAKLRTGSDRGWNLTRKAWTGYNLRARLDSTASASAQPNSWFDVVASAKRSADAEAEAKVAQAQTGVPVDSTQPKCPVCASAFERICDETGAWRFAGTVRPQRGPGKGTIFHMHCFSDFMTSELERVAAAAAAGASPKAKGEEEVEAPAMPVAVPVVPTTTTAAAAEPPPAAVTATEEVDGAVAASVTSRPGVKRSKPDGDGTEEGDGDADASEEQPAEKKPRRRSSRKR